MEPAVATEGLQKRYGRSWAVRGVDLVVEAGQIYGLLGLVRSTAGHVFLMDEPELGDANYYYVRVLQADGEMAWSSPVWVS
jgi:ABC-type histidine transport system ATPase subunit